MAREDEAEDLRACRGSGGPFGSGGGAVGARAGAAARALADAAPALMWVADAGGARIAFNNAWLAHRGRTADLEIGDGWTEGIHPDDRAGTLERWAAVVGTGRRARLEYRLLRGDGSCAWIVEDVAPQLGADGALTGYLGCCAEVTDHVRAAEALVDHHVESIAIVAADEGLTVLHVNPAMLRLYAIARTAAIHAPVAALFGGDCSHDLERLRHACGSEGARFESVHKAQDGNPVQVEIDARHVHWHGSDALLVVARNLAEEARAEREREELRAQVREAQKLEAIGVLAAGVTHDFNNLLTAIRGYADIVRREVAPDHVAHSSLDRIEEACSQAADVTDSLLTFARTSPQDRVPIDLADVVAMSLQLLQRLLPASITVIADLPDDDPVWVSGASQQLQQCIFNLAINARDAMPRGGTLTVHLREEPVEDGPNPFVQLTIEDSGAGIPADVARRIFEPFFTTKPHGRGTGLGLSVVHGIIEDHDGHIECKSSVGRGTRFEITMPTCPAPGPANDLERPAPPPAAGGLVLVAEDDDFVRELILASLESSGYAVATASDGDEAVRLVRSRADDARLLVLDLDLPGRSGHACIDAIAREGLRIPVLALTRDLEDGVHPAGVHIEALAKPFSMQDLVDQVSTMIAGDK